MAHLNDDIRKDLTKAFEQLESPVKLLVFTKPEECQYCVMVREMAEELASISDLVSAEILDFAENKAEADRYGVDKVPAIVLIGKEDYGLRYYGVPSGHEFPTLIESIVDVSRGPAEMPAEIAEGLAKIDSPVRIEVLSTPT